MNKHLNNVCIIQKYNDSEKVLELREQFKESEAFIKKAVNCHDELVEALKASIRIMEQIKPESVANYGPIQRRLEQAKQALSRAEAV